MGRCGYIFGQFRETARCRDAQHGDGVCCAFAPQPVCWFVGSFVRDARRVYRKAHDIWHMFSICAKFYC